MASVPGHQRNAFLCTALGQLSDAAAVRAAGGIAGAHRLPDELIAALRRRGVMRPLLGRIVALTDGP